MECKTVLEELESLGTAQNRKVYGRHGVKGPMFGVSYKNQGLLAKRIKTDHALARKLWDSGNHDARVLATMVADPARLDGPTAESWAAALDNYALADAVAKLVSQSPLARAKASKWIKSKQEFIAAAGWSITGYLALYDGDLPDSHFAGLVPRIEKQIHTSPNRTRYSMNMALIAIGIRSAGLRKLALAAAKKIGKVQVDHGETGCQTPDAAAYIAKTVARRRAKAAAK
jgi:3-methyladenine DNA glycosylase AlkD